ncbi:hypothetical protein ACQR1Y_07990 [Bradyrhizobium sp. HKCCYLRH3099]|uniref:hypothetical protein n=1 Tax=unclassified Bradyrhizobium TaxID=2631580 RepID=UPI003EC0B2A8
MQGDEAKRASHNISIIGFDRCSGADRDHRARHGNAYQESKRALAAPADDFDVVPVPEDTRDGLHR